MSQPCEPTMPSPSVEHKAFILLLALVTIAFFWILLPFYGAVFWAIVLAVSTTVTKVMTGIWAAGRQGIGRQGRLRAGAALVARGEFSIVIAGLAVAAGAVEGQLAALATAYVLLMAVLGPVAARVAEPLAKTLLRSKPTV